jgi:hypothetical protein
MSIPGVVRLSARPAPGFSPLAQLRQPEQPAEVVVRTAAAKAR